MNFVIILTDTQCKSMVGAYGNPRVDTPSLDALASGGIRFERAYTTCPLCTPARGGLFTGLHPQVNGAFCNNVAPFGHVAFMGTALHHYGYRAGYTGKWHLDGSAYFGDGMPGGDFDPEWWYDGKRYAEDIGEEMFRAYRSARTPDDLRASGFAEEMIWGHRVADRAVDFLSTAGEEPFLLVCSFDEPHGPFVAPAEYWERFTGEEIPRRPNYNAPLDDKPELHRVQRSQRPDEEWEDYVRSPHVTHWYGCNSYIDREIGRVVKAVDQHHREDTLVLYTSDHGDQSRSHGLTSKGPMMYEESTNIPLIVRIPGGPAGVVSDQVVSHIDILPTILDLAGLEIPEVLNGKALAPSLEDPTAPSRDAALISFHRFAINQDSNGEFYPIRAVVDRRFKLVVNLMDTDELYDLQEDPYELENRIGDVTLSQQRDRLHDWMLEEMDRIRDPFRSWRWGSRDWRSVRKPFYFGGAQRGQPGGFPFQPTSV